MALETLNSPTSGGPLLYHDQDMLYDDQPWTKGKRTKRARLDSESDHHNPTEEEYLALCLLMLAKGERSIDRPEETTTAPDPPPPSSSSSNGYKCTICHRTFHSYQALGGHKTSHKNKPAVMEASRTDDPTAAEASLGPVPSPQRMTRRPALVNSISNGISRTHRCSVCLKSFSSGQALGGHKRRHFEGGSRTSRLTSPSDQDTDPGDDGHRHDFDLNLPASLEYAQEANNVDFTGKSQHLNSEEPNKHCQ